MRSGLRRLLVIALVTAGLGLAAAVPPALAGGPTSVLIVQPHTGRTGAAYHHDPDYRALDAMLMSGSESVKQDADGDYGSRGSGRMITITWLIHDVWVWRVHRVFPDAPGGPWVLSYQAADTGTLPELGSWSRPTEPRALVALLDRVLAPSAEAQSTETHPTEPPSTAATPAAVAPAGASGSSPWSAGATVAAVLTGSAGLVLLGWAVGSGRLRRRAAGPPTDQLMTQH